MASPALLLLLLSLLLFAVLRWQVGWPCSLPASGWSSPCLLPVLLLPSSLAAGGFFRPLLLPPDWFAEVLAASPALLLLLPGLLLAAVPPSKVAGWPCWLPALGWSWPCLLLLPPPPSLAAGRFFQQLPPPDCQVACSMLPLALLALGWVSLRLLLLLTS